MSTTQNKTPSMSMSGELMAMLECAGGGKLTLDLASTNIPSNPSAALASESMAALPAKMRGTGHEGNAL